MRNHLLLACVIGLGLLTGCSTFKRDYASAAKSPAAPESVEGAWSGKWRSFDQEHHGPIQAILTRVSDKTYHARFLAKYAGFVEYEQDVDLQVIERSPLKVEGEKDLGYFAGGEYVYTATLTPTTFDARYRSRSGTGEFKMTRPE